MIASWNDVTNHMNLEECTENNNGQWNEVMLESNGKRCPVMTMCSTVDNNSKCVNSCKAQRERKCSKIKREKDIRDEILKEPKN